MNCVLGLKSYSEWKQEGGTGVWKFGGNIKSNASVKQIVRKNSEPFTSSLSRNMYEKPKNGASIEAEKNKTVGKLCLTEKSITCIENNEFNGRFINQMFSLQASSSLSMLVRAILTDKRPEEVPNVC